MGSFLVNELYPLFMFILFCLFVKKMLQQKVKSSIDNKYHVVKHNKDQHIAADILAQLKQKTQNLILVCKDKYNHIPQVLRLVNSIDIENGINENVFNPFHSSYTLNKNEIGLCLRSSNGDFHELNKLFFVLLHELAHMMSESIGHTEEFWNNFKLLLRISIENGLYQKMNVDQSNPTEYCGEIINYEPI